MIGTLLKTFLKFSASSISASSISASSVSASIILGLALLVTAAGAETANVAGKWAGTVDVHDVSSGTDVSTPIEVQFEEPQSGTLSGKIGREGDADAVPIRNAVLTGKQLSFEAASGETSGPMKFTLMLDGDQLTGQIRGAIDTQEIAGRVKLSRQGK